MELPEIILIINWSVALSISIYLQEYREVYGKMDLKTFGFQLLILAIILPIIEESLFRETLVNLLKHSLYYKEFITTLFALVHLLNSTIGVSTNKMATCQFVCSIYLGNYLINLDNVGKSIIVHSVYNGSMIITIYVLAKILMKSNDDMKSDKTFDDLITSPIHKQYLHVPYHTLRKSTSIGNHMDTKNNYNTGKRIVIDDLTDEVRKSIHNYNDMDRMIRDNFVFGQMETVTISMQI
jgi:hypothetical protein